MNTTSSTLLEEKNHDQVLPDNELNLDDVLGHDNQVAHKPQEQPLPMVKMERKPEPKLMDIESFVHKMRDLLTEIDKVEEEIVNTTVSIMSPAFTTNSAMPTFSKKTISGSGSQDQELYRSKTLSTEFGRLSQVLAKTQDKISKVKQQVDLSSSEMTANQAPTVNQLRQLAKTKFAKNSIVSSRLDGLASLFEDTIAKSRYHWHTQSIYGESAIHSAKALSETLLKTIYNEPSRLATIFKAEFDRHFMRKIQDVQKWNMDQKRKLVARQRELHKMMFDLVRHQHEAAKHLLKILRDQLQSLPQRDRTRADTRIRELQANADQLFVQAELYYQQSTIVLTQQPMSPLLQERSQKWFCDVQIFLCQILNTLVKSDQKDEAHLPQVVKNSVLYQFANKMDAGLIADRAVVLLSQPSSATVTDILQSFITFFNNQTKENLAKSKARVAKLETDYKTLTQQIKQTQADQQNWLAHGENAVLPDASGKSQTRSAQTIRALLRQGTDIKAMNANLENTYRELFSNARPDYLRAEENKLSSENFISFLSDFKKTNQYWEQLVTSERDLCAQRLNHSRALSRYSSGIFLEWNHFLSTEMDELGQGLSLYSIGMLHRIQQLLADWAKEYLFMTRERHLNMENEITLIDQLCEQIRQDDIGAADEVARITAQITNWVKQNDRANLSSLESKWLTEIDFHVGRLQELMDLWAPTKNSREPLRQFLDMLDTMYDTTSFGGDARREADQIRAHDEKIQRASQQLSNI